MFGRHNSQLGNPPGGGALFVINANGKPVSIPLGLTKDYQIEPFKDAAQGNTPPVLRVSPGGAPLQGPPKGYAASLAATVGQPLTLTLWATDDGIVDPNRKVPEWPVNVTWFKHRGPGAVTILPLAVRSPRHRV